MQPSSTCVSESVLSGRSSFSFTTSQPKSVLSNTIKEFFKGSFAPASTASGPYDGKKSGLQSEQQLFHSQAQEMQDANLKSLVTSSGPFSISTTHTTSSSSSFSFVSSLEQVGKSVKTCIPSPDNQSFVGHAFKKPLSTSSAAASTESPTSTMTSTRRSEKSSEKAHLRNSSDDDGKKCNYSEVIPHLTSIICKGIHPDVNKKAVLHTHFSQFGSIKKITCSRKNCQAVIRYDTHASAERAKKGGSEILPFHEPLSIFWFQGSSPKKEEKRKSKQSLSSNPDIDAELHAMLEGREDHKILSRPDKKEVVPAQRRKVQPKTTTQKRSSTQSESLTDSSESNLLKVLQQEAHTAEECFRILDTRDKLLRLNLKKQSDFATARNLLGTCTDMCPEKERYSRFAKKGLSIFEQKKLDNKGTSAEPVLDHQLIVKEYSRSSADQEEPLPHELRPAQALELTMDYLLCNIINKVKDDHISIGEWYDFIWNRTRAIRKDITQQHLCEISCVAIVEKCARFHIHCAAVLCEEDISVFDPKINDENLTKCLQTLKHLYHDLAEKHLECPNEPEFRAYDILLSLKEGDTLRHVQRLRKDIRNTPEVQFAVGAALALSSNNYVYFFNLVEKATYLNACILHRYFSELRLRAIQIILKAFCAPSRTEQYPIENLSRILKFNNLSDAAEFCKMLGFRIESNFVFLDRLAFAPPLSTSVSVRSAVVENKQTLPLGEVLNKGGLPANPLNSYVPHNSFDKEGYLKKEAFQALDQTSKEVNTHKIAAKTGPLSVQFSVPSTSAMGIVQGITTALPKSHQPEVPDSDVGRSVFKLPTSTKTISRSTRITENLNLKLEEDVYMAGATSIEQNKASAKQEVKAQEISELYDCILDDVLNSTLGSISSDVSSIERHVEKRQEESTLKDVSDRLLQEVISNELATLIIEERCAIREAYMHDLSNSFSEDILEKCIENQLFTMATEIYEDEKKDWVYRLKCIQKKVNILRAKKVLLLWRGGSTARRRLEACRNIFPSLPPLCSKAKRSNAFSLDNPAVGLSHQKHVSRLLGTGVLYQTIREELAWRAFDLAPLFENCISRQICFPRLSPETHYWKLLLLYEENEEDANYSLLIKWLHSKFTKGYVQQDTFDHSHICSLYWLTDAVGKRIAVCVRSIAIGTQFEEVLSNIKEGSMLNGTCAVLLFMQKASLEQTERIKSFQSSLMQLLNTTSLLQPVPLYCLVFGNSPKSPFQMQKFFSDLKNQKMLFRYQASYVDLSDCLYVLSKRVFDATGWLVLHCPPFPEFVTEYLSDFVQDGIVAAFNVIYQDLSHRKNQNSVSQNPQCIIEFFNLVMKHRASVVESDSLNSTSLPISELSTAHSIGRYLPLWHSKKEFSEIKDKINAMILPDFDGDPTVLKNVWLYVWKILSVFKKSSHFVISRIHQLIMKAELGQIRELLWADVIYECVIYASTCLGFLGSTSGNKKQIHYVQNELQKLDLASEWQNIILSYSPSLKRKCPWEENACTKMQKKEKEQVRNTVGTPEQQPKLFYCNSLSTLEQMLASEKLESEAFILSLQESALMQPGALALPSHRNWCSIDVWEMKSCESSEVLCTALNNGYGTQLSHKVELFKQELENENQAEKAFESKLKGLLI